MNVEVSFAVMEYGDVAHCFAVFLGASPQPDVARRCMDAGLHVVLRDLIESEGFRNEVLAPLLLREPLPQERLASVPSLPTLDWVQRRLPIGHITRCAVGAVRSWTQLLELLLSDPAFVSVAPLLAAAEIDVALRERLEREPFSKVRRSVVGALDSASALEVRGWAMDLCDKAVPVTIELYSDNLFLGAVTCGNSRPDVKEAVGGDGMCGFVFLIPASRRAGFGRGRTLVAIDSVSRERIGAGIELKADMTSSMDVLSATRSEVAKLREILERIEARLPDLARVSGVPIEAYDEYWMRFYRRAPDTLAQQRTACAGFAYRPLFSIVLPTWNSNLRLLERALASAFAQTYAHWELLICDDCSPPSDEFKHFITRHCADSRVRFIGGTERAGIAGNTNRGIREAQGDYVAFLDHDDELAVDALFEFASVLQERKYGLVYSDEDRIEEDAVGRCVHHSPFFKPDFDPDLLMSINYLCHFVALRRDIVARIEGFRAGFEGAQDHDLFLRAVENLETGDIRHVPKILYHWRVTPGSVSRTPHLALAIQENINKAVQQHLDRRGCLATATAHSDPLGAARPFATRLRWKLPPTPPSVSVIIPTRDRIELLRPCVESIQRSAAFYPGRLEILIVDNDSTDASTRDYFASLSTSGKARVTPFEGAFNWSAINNAAARVASGEILVFLNNDTVVLTEDWCAELAASAMRPDVGAVGARLLYADGTLQHSGVVLGVDGVAGHDSVGEPPELGGYFGRTHLQRSASAVTGACLATRREVFERTGGFDEMHLKVAFNDVDYCLRAAKLGLRVIYNPFCVFYHFESKSRGHDLTEEKQARHRAEAATFRSRWGASIDSDPFFNPHFERFGRPFERLRQPP